MVCRRMGLLDDAIREHLELKRLRGADPGLVAREEHEAFGPFAPAMLRRARTTMAAPRSSSTNRPARTLRGSTTIVCRSRAWTMRRKTTRRRTRCRQAMPRWTLPRCRGCPRGRCPGLLEAWARRPPSLTCARCSEEADHDHGPVDGHGHDHDPALPGETTMHSGRLPSRSPPSSPHDVPGQEQLFEQRPARDFGSMSNGHSARPTADSAAWPP